jgi:hypothetical protein
MKYPIKILFKFLDTHGVESLPMEHRFQANNLKWLAMRPIYLLNGLGNTT